MSRNEYSYCPEPSNPTIPALSGSVDPTAPNAGISEA
jgi:hypothetical protein